MRILQVVPRLSQKYGGGGAVIATSLAKELAKRKHFVAIMSSDFGYWSGDYRDLERKVWVFTSPTVLNFATLHITPSMFHLSKATLDLFNVIHMQGCRTFQNIAAYHYAKKYKIPYIVDSHGFPIEGTWLRKLFIRIFDALFANRIVRDAKFCVAESQTGAQEFKRAGVKKDKIVVIPAPYDLSIFDSLPKRGQFRKRLKLQQQRVVLYLGGIEYIKGLDFLIKSFARQKGDDAILVLVGEDMGYRKILEKLIDDLGISDKVLFTGGLYGQEKLEALVDADVAVFPSRAEQGLSFAALEAIMCNTPVIVTDGTGAAEDIRKLRCGFVSSIKGDKVNNLYESIKFVLSEVKEAKEVTNVGQKNIRKNLSISEKVKDYEKLYERCLSK